MNGFKLLIGGSFSKSQPINIFWIIQNNYVDGSNLEAGADGMGERDLVNLSLNDTCSFNRCLNEDWKRG
jgi:hypothetical protein